MKQKSNQDYFREFVKSAIRELNTNGICYVYNIEQINVIKEKTKRELDVKLVDCGLEKSYVITYKKGNLCKRI